MVQFKMCSKENQENICQSEDLQDFEQIQYNPCIPEYKDDPCQTKFKYIQPPVRESCKPLTNYQKLNEPMDSDTIYKKSYYQYDGKTLKEARLPAFKIKDNIEKTCSKMETLTISNLSYPRHCNVQPTAPLIPKPSDAIVGDGAFNGETTQKHDYVRKESKKRMPIFPSENLQRLCGDFDKNTINKMSFQPFDIMQLTPAKPMRPLDVRPCFTGPTDFETIYKLSFKQVDIPCKEIYPWAQKEKHTAYGRFDNNTTYKMSFLPNCNFSRVLPIIPKSTWKELCKCNVDDKTVYKTSFFGANTERPQLVKQKSMIEIPTGKHEKCTIYKLSFPGHFGLKRSMTFQPKSSIRTKPNQIVCTTTNRNDFSPKQLSRRTPKLPKNKVNFPDASFEDKTINKLSYGCLNMKDFKRPEPIKPINTYQKPNVPMENLTTNKLSFLPIEIPTCKEKEPHSAAYRTNIVKPTSRLDTKTVYKMSFPAPGKFVLCNGEGGMANGSFPDFFAKCNKKYDFGKNIYPRAEIVN